MHGDLMTVLRHLAENAQWGGNRGERDETFAALDRLSEGFRRETEAETTPETPQDAQDTSTEPKGPAAPTKAAGRTSKH